MDNVTSVTKVTSEGWGSRIGASIKGILFGGVLFLGSFVLLFLNEGRAVHRAQDLEQGQSACVAISADTIDPGNEGKLVHTSGLATTSEEVADAQFKIKLVALKLRRKVEIYQWTEDSKTETRKKMGGGTESVTTYTYKTEWSNGPVDSSKFHSSSGHENHGVMHFESQSWMAHNVTLGAFSLTTSQVDRIDAWQSVILAEDYLSDLSPEVAEIGIEPQVVGGNTVYFGVDPSQPDVGDLRVTFEQVPPTTVSLICQQIGSSFQPWVSPRGGQLDELKEGTLGMEQFFLALKKENTILTWLLRLAGFVIMALGLGMIGKPLAVIGDVVPFIGSIVGAGVGLVAILGAGALSLITIGIAWLVYRPVLGIGLLVAAIALIFLLKKMGGAKTPAAA